LKNIKVTSVQTIEYAEEKPVYCFREEKRERGMFEGVVTGNCTEIIEYSDDKEYAVCNLGSIGLPSFLSPNPNLGLLHQNNLEIIIVEKEKCGYCSLLTSYLHELSIPYKTASSLEQVHLKRVNAWKTFPAVFFVHKKETPNITQSISYKGGFSEMWTDYLCPIFNHQGLYEVVYRMTENLNQVIDKNVYPVPETEKSNLRHRPIGLGVQGLADVFCSLRLPFDDVHAKTLNREIFETLYFASLSASHDLAVKQGPYTTFQGSPLSRGLFHFDLCSDFQPSVHLSSRWDWESLRQRIKEEGGVRNSLLVAPMPTASTSQILGNNECFEPYTSNLYLRRTSVGEFYVSNDFLLKDLKRMGMWNDDVTRQRLLASKGSIHDWGDVPASVRHLYRTVWEISQKSIIEMAWERHFFIDQSQSLNLFVENPTLEKLTKMHFYSWNKGLKTGCYYLRSRGGVSSVSVAVDPNLLGNKNSKEKDDETECLSCSA
jgi:ribonucleotide reductase alpha subunit